MKESFKSCVSAGSELGSGDGNKLAKSLVGIENFLCGGFADVKGQGSVDEQEGAVGPVSGWAKGSHSNSFCFIRPSNRSTQTP